MNQPPSLIERRMRNANPVPDENVLPSDARAATDALAIVRQLVAERPVPEPVLAAPRRVRRPQRLIAAAAAFVGVAVLGIVIYLIGTGDTPEPPVTTVTTVTTTTVEPTTTTSSSTTTSTSTTTTSTTSTPSITARRELFPGTEKFSFGALEPGPVAMEYSVPVPMRIEIPDVTPDFPLGWFVEQPSGRGPAVSLRDSMVQGGTVEDLPPPFLIFVMTRTGDAPDVVAAELALDLGEVEFSETEVVGRPAIQIDTGVLDVSVPMLSLGTQSTGQPIFGNIPGNQHRFYLLDTPNGTLVIWYDIPGELWDVLSAYYDRIVASMELAGPID